MVKFIEILLHKVIVMHSKWCDEHELSSLFPYVRVDDVKALGSYVAKD